MRTQIRPAIMCLICLTLITGVLYPAIVTSIAKIVFPHQSAGSLIEHNGKTVGSTLIGQPFDDPKYFWPRPSATVIPYDAAAGAGSNLAPTNPALAEAVKQRLAALQVADPTNSAAVPVDLVTASASGLDPHISPAAARYQIARVARIRSMPVATVQSLVDQHTEERTFGVLGEPRVNVLRLNLALDDQAPSTTAPSR